MYKKILLAFATVVATSGAAAQATNLALNSTISATGTGFGISPAKYGTGTFAPLSSVTDGGFVKDGQQWNKGTVFWTGWDNWLTITLPQTVNVNSITLQADNNDLYGVSYRDTQNTWHTLGNINPNTTNWGMAKGTMTIYSADPILATAFRVGAAAGDDYYSVSEFQVTGSVSAVPEPETYGMLLAGLGLVSMIARRKHNCC